MKPESTAQLEPKVTEGKANGPGKERPHKEKKDKEEENTKPITWVSLFSGLGTLRGSKEGT